MKKLVQIIICVIIILLSLLVGVSFTNENFETFKKHFKINTYERT